MRVLDRDLLTPDQYPLAAEAEGTRQLYFTCGGSFHGFEFLPIIGEIIARVVLGTIEPDGLYGRTVRGMGGDREAETVPFHSSVVPKDTR
jgi:hypothetical protein